MSSNRSVGVPKSTVEVSALPRLKVGLSVLSSSRAEGVPMITVGVPWATGLHGSVGGIIGLLGRVGGRSAVSISNVDCSIVVFRDMLKKS